MDADANLAGASPDEIEDAIAEALTRMAAQGSVPAANAALKLVEQRRQATASSSHRAKMLELAESPTTLCQYLGELGQAAQVAVRILDRELTDVELAAISDGVLSRKIEIRAIELGRARKGGSIERWMAS